MESGKNLEAVWYKNASYTEKIELAREKLSNMVGSFVEAGYWIRSIWEDEECKKHGYSTIWEMAEAEFGLKKSEASRAINMNKKYSVGGNSPIILEKYSMYSKSQLQEMLTIKSEELEQKVTADMTVEEIRQLKKTGATVEELEMLREVLVHYAQGAYAEIFKVSRELGGEISEIIKEKLEWDVPVKYGNKVFFTGDDKDELVERVTGEVLVAYAPDIAVKMILEEYQKLHEVRQIKEAPEPVNTESDRALEAESVTESVATSQEPVNTESEVLLETEIVEEIEVQEEVITEYLDFEVLEEEEEEENEEVTIIDGEFRELPVVEELSAYGFMKTVYPEGSSLATVGCGYKYSCFNCAQNCGIRQEERYCVEAPLGNPFTCTTMNVMELLEVEMGDICQFVNHELACYTAGSHEPVPCCKLCQVEICGYRCGKSVHPKKDKTDMVEVEDSQVAAVETNELANIKKILGTEKMLLESYLEFDDLPEFTLVRQKIIVGALANMLCELEEIGEKEVIEQPELTILKNNDQRQEFIAGYVNWPVWIEQPLTGEKYYRYEFENGTTFVVKVYFHKCFDYNLRSVKWEERYKDDWGAEEYYIVSDGKHFKDCLTNKSAMIEFLKNLQKGEK